MAALLTMTGGDCRPSGRRGGVIDGIYNGLSSGHGHFKLNTTDYIAIEFGDCTFGRFASVKSDKTTILENQIFGEINF